MIFQALARPAPRRATSLAVIVAVNSVIAFAYYGRLHARSCGSRTPPDGDTTPDPGARRRSPRRSVITVGDHPRRRHRARASSPTSPTRSASWPSAARSPTGSGRSMIPPALADAARRWAGGRLRRRSSTLALYDPVDGFYATGGRAGRPGATSSPAPRSARCSAPCVARGSTTPGERARPPRSRSWWSRRAPGPGTLARVGARGRARRAPRPCATCSSSASAVAAGGSTPSTCRAGSGELDGDDLAVVRRAARAGGRAPPFASSRRAARRWSTGVVIANELLDNLAFDVVRRAGRAAPSSWSVVAAGDDLELRSSRPTAAVGAVLDGARGAAAGVWVPLAAAGRGAGWPTRSAASNGVGSSSSTTRHRPPSSRPGRRWGGCARSGPRARGPPARRPRHAGHHHRRGRRPAPARPPGRPGCAPRPSGCARSASTSWWRRAGGSGTSGPTPPTSRPSGPAAGYARPRRSPIPTASGAFVALEWDVGLDG